MILIEVTQISEEINVDATTTLIELVVEPTASPITEIIIEEAIDALAKFYAQQAKASEDAAFEHLQATQAIAATPGPQGEKGDTGDQGIQGIQGEKGDKGDTGEQGIQGIQGEKGDTGDQGIQGIPGSDATVTEANIIAALGYTPADEAVLGDIATALDLINGV
jgi:hypothetical protein